MQKRNKTAVLAIITLFTSIILIGCTKVNGDGPVITEDRRPGDFSAIHFAIPGNLLVSSEPGNSLTVRAQKNIADLIETYVQDNTLYIRLKSNTVINSHEPIEVVARTPHPKAIHLSGSGNIKTSLPIINNEFLLESSGSGNIEVGNLETGEIRARISGSGRISINQGIAGSGKVTINGSGQALFSGLQADTVYTQTSGSGDITLWVGKYLESEISGSGTVRYKGNPVVKKKVSGSGTVSPW